MSRFPMELNQSSITLGGLARLPWGYAPSDGFEQRAPLRVAPGQTLLAVVGLRNPYPIKRIQAAAALGGLDEVAIQPVGLIVYPEASAMYPDPVLEDDAVDVPGRGFQTWLLKAAAPRDLAPGVYEGTIFFQSATHEPTERRFKVEVLPLVGASSSGPEKISFWPHWVSLCRHYGIAAWSEEFWEMAGRYLAELASAGTNVARVNIVDDPHDNPFPPECRHIIDSSPTMVEWVRSAAGDWKFDFGIYDRYVQLAVKHGIDREIECHSLIRKKASVNEGGKTSLRFRDQASGRIVEQDVAYDAPEHVAAWKAFFRAFAAHNRERGWLNKVMLCPFDEPRALEPYMFMARLAKDTAPEYRISGAIDAREALAAKGVMDIATISASSYTREAHEALRNQGVAVRWYNCCGPDWGNVLFCCSLADSYRIPWMTAANGLDGYLRWSAFCWLDDPYREISFRWPTGDTCLLYPGRSGPASSLRWEALKMGLHDVELMRAVCPDPWRAANPGLQQHLAAVGHMGRIETPTDVQVWRNRLYDILLAIRR